MTRFFRRPSLLAAALALGLQACGGTELPADEVLPAPSEAVAGTQQLIHDAVPGDILTALQAIPGLTVVREAPPPAPGVRHFVLSYDQPADHWHPEGTRFQQRLTLRFVSAEAPMVLGSSGYAIGTQSYRLEPTALLQANQLMVEHRFFEPSRPNPANWKLLTIEQAAADHHRIVQAFKPLFAGKWISTGASKGGMTSVYHRAFYPNDVDATVAYVAPNSYGTQDPRYVAFLSKRGTPECRERIRGFQREVLERRAETEAVFDARTQWLSYELLGHDKALEFTVLEFAFAFWQYGNASRCGDIPAPGATAEELVDFLDAIVGLSYMSDSDLDYYAPYDFQAATQLGSYASEERHLRGVQRYPGGYDPRALVPFDMKPYKFNPFAMPLIEGWVKAFGQRILFVYGENDPWSTGAFDVRSRNDSYRFYVPGGNHGSSIRTLPEADRAVALERLGAWAGVPATIPLVGLKNSAGEEDIRTGFVDRRRAPPRD
ncbi:S28 family serine protease [Corallococcus sp. bb12-1]|uniref:S28 family serine protease n=1 Tax=Corallococcus sp. bb12-1 TaxID=2996784 RepID=UPI002271C892|nr:S28 family serine protease [Corallococcus sp. bb12-1]MCY1044571.1 S28 family serine protease [Corallococcus sp. bb12-1]